MLPLPNGNELFAKSYPFEILESSQIGEVRRFCARICEALDFTEERAYQVTIVINELGNNLIKYAVGGVLIIRADRHEDQNILHIISIDSGPGMLDVEVNMRDGYTTGTTPGTGLGAVRRLSDAFDIYSDTQGTIISSIHGSRTSNINEEFLIGAVTFPFSGEVFCGDAWAFRCAQGSCSLIASDGLGHGEHAYRTSLLAVEMFLSKPNLKLDEMMMLLHSTLKRTRGAAIFLLNIVRDQIQFAGVGNIRTVICFPDNHTQTLISQNGTAGLQVRDPRVLSEEWPRGSAIVLHSDGIQTRWDLSRYKNITLYHPNILAAALMRDYRRPNDDSMIVVLTRRK